MYYARDNGVGTGEAPAGAIAITKEQYFEALERMGAGECVTVAGGVLAFFIPEQRPGTVYLIDADGFYLGMTHDPQAGQTFDLQAPPKGLLKPKCVNGEWVEGATAEELELDRTAKIKAKAREIILGRLPDWKQVNLIARAAELTEKRATGETLNSEEEVELAACKAEWTWVKSVRTKSDEAELDGSVPDAIDWPVFEA